MSQQKAFVGIVNESSINEFSDANGVLVRCWKLAVLLSEDRGMVFNIGIDDPNYSHVSGIPEGTRVKIIANSSVRNDGKVKWKLTEISVVGNEDV